MTAAFLFYQSRAPPAPFDFQQFKNRMEETSMKFTDSDYAANKSAKGIVYRFADETVEISLTDYLRENPGKTESDFAELKALSDTDYYERDRSHYRQTWKNISLDFMGDVLESAEPSPEDEIITLPEQEKALTQKHELAALALNKLTETQRRRYLMYHLGGKTEEEIAALEGVAQQSVSECLLGAQKKMKKILSNA